MLNSVSRPVLRYHGGKFRLRGWITSHFPPHRIYVEPFGGAGSVLMAKQRSYAEIYNDLDENVVNVFRVLREPEQAARLAELLALTPFARSEFLLSYEDSPDPVEQARRTITRAFMGFSSDAITRPKRGKTGFRNNSHCGVFCSMDWRNFPPQVMRFCERLQGVLIESMDALALIRKFDTPGTLFYLDPPYVKSTRYDGEKSKAYNFEMTDVQHRELGALCNSLQGMVIISGFACELYDKMFAGWFTLEKEAFGQSAVKGSKSNMEKLWISPNARTTLPLFR